MSERKTTAERITAKKEEMEQKKNELTLLLQRQRKEERKARTHRLCERGGKLEKLFPELARLTEEQFETFVERCLLTSQTRSVLTELAPPEPGTYADDKSGVTKSGGDITAATAPVATRTDTGPALKSEETAHNSGANNNGKPARQNGDSNNHKPSQMPAAPSVADAGRTGDATRVAG